MSRISRRFGRALALHVPALMRAALAVVLMLITTSAAGAESTRPPESFAAVVDAVKASVVSIVRASPRSEDGDDEYLRPDEIFRELFDVFDALPNRILGAG